MVDGTIGRRLHLEAAARRLACARARALADTPLAQSALEAVATLGAVAWVGGAGGGTAGGMGGPIPADTTRPHPC